MAEVADHRENVDVETLAVIDLEHHGQVQLSISAGDREFIAVMRQYFAAQTELESLRSQLEAARQAAGHAIGVFYDPRQNAGHATDLRRSHRLKGEMTSLMQRAEAWGRAASGADQNDTSEAEAEPQAEEWQSFEKRADAFFGAQRRLDNQPGRSSVLPFRVVVITRRLAH